MKRTQLQLDDNIYEAIRQRAFQNAQSMASVLREAINAYFGSQKKAGEHLDLRVREKQLEIDGALGPKPTFNFKDLKPLAKRPGALKRFLDDRGRY